MIIFIHNLHSVRLILLLLLAQFFFFWSQNKSSYVQIISVSVYDFFHLDLWHIYVLITLDLYVGYQILPPSFKALTYDICDEIIRRQIEVEPVQFKSDTAS